MLNIKLLNKLFFFKKNEYFLNSQIYKFIKLQAAKKGKIKIKFFYIYVCV